MLIVNVNCETLCCLQSTKTDVLREKLEESEKLMSEISKTWEEKLKETEKMHQVSVNASSGVSTLLVECQHF